MAAKKLKLTDEMKQKLYGYTLAKGTLKYKVEIDEDLPKEFIPVFEVRNLTNDEYNTFKKLSADAEDDTEVEKSMLELVRKCIVGWENLIDIANEVYILFEGDENGGANKEIFDELPLTIKLGIFNFIMKLNGIM